jgi:ribosome-binding ATPase YchF (GTP1/OBG family)
MIRHEPCFGHFQGLTVGDANRYIGSPMKIGIVGYQGSGKTTLFEWLTGVASDPAIAHQGQSAMAPVPDERIAQLCEVYHPKKITMASLELVDTPGLSRTHEGSAARLGLIREAESVILVVAAFDGSDPITELNSFLEDTLLADLEIVSGRVERLRESTKKPRPNRDQEIIELAALEQVLAALESGKPMAAASMTDEQIKATRSFRLMSEKSRLVLINLADDDDDPARFGTKAPDGTPLLAVRVGLERELAKMSPEDRADFETEMGLSGSRKDEVLRTILDVSEQMLYFTAGEKEVRTWMLRKNGTALEAAANIHTDLARGFIRAEIMKCDDLVRLGSERELKAQNLTRQEPKDYVVRDGDILNIKFNV